MSLLEIENITKTFLLKSGIFNHKVKTICAVNGVSFKLEEGNVIGIVGESGSGKTTLGKIITRLIKPDSGNIFIEGTPIDKFSRKELSSKVQMIFQDPFSSLNPKLNIFTILKESILGIPYEKAQNIIYDILKVVGLDGNILYLYPHQFSGGQRQRIAIARTLLKNPRIIVADEPLSALDVSIQVQLLSLFLKLKKDLNLSFIFISHDLIAASIISDYIMVMKDGIIVEQGKTQKIIKNPEHGYTKRLIESVPLFNCNI